MASKFGKIKNPRLKKQWLADLRSGNFKQTTNNLCDAGLKNLKAKYCCLGVLGRSCQKTKLFNVVFKNPLGDTKALSYKNDECDQNLPGSLAKDIGLTPKAENRLVEMNDENGKNFKEIANWIEKHL